MWPSIARACLNMDISHKRQNSTFGHLGIFSSMKRFGILSVRCRKSDGSRTETYRHTNTHIRGSRCSSRSGNKLVRKAGDKRARAHCPGIRDEQRCENVTTNSPWSPNVTSPLYSTPLPSSYSVPVSPLFNLLLFLFFSLHFFPSTHHTLLFSSLSSSAPPLILWQCFPFHLLERTDRGREQSKRISFPNSAPLLSVLPLLYALLFFSSSIHPGIYLPIHFLSSYWP